MEKLFFASDYQEGTHPDILKRLCETNMESTAGYGLDSYSESARNKIRQACQCPGADIHFLIGGTQANATVIDSLLPSYQGVIAADSGHVSVHEAGAIELTRHKVLSIPGRQGKLSPQQLEEYCATFLQDGNHDHMVAPGMVYLSQPTEYGTLYSLAELTAIREICDSYGLKLYIDGARLAYALACKKNDVTLPDLARLCDVFYIGGTKCGLLFGEAVVIPKPELIPHFFTLVKQHGALLAKGRIAGVQFDTLFTDDLYGHIGTTALEAADRLRSALKEKGYTLSFDSPTNQVFITIENERLDRLAPYVEYSYWEKYDRDHTIIRFATSWATRTEDVEKLIAIL